MYNNLLFIRKRRKILLNCSRTKHCSVR